MPSQEATMPPIPPYPYSSEEDSSSTSNLEPVSKKIDIVTPHQSKDSSDFLRKHWKGSVEDLKDHHKQVSISCPDYQDSNNYSREHARGKYNRNSRELVNDTREYRSLFNRTEDPLTPVIQLTSIAFGTKGVFNGSFTPEVSWIIIRGAFRFPREIFGKIISHLDHSSLLSARITSRPWREACNQHRPIQFPPLYRLPVELIQLILEFSSPPSFDAARYACRAWYLSSLDPSLLRSHLKTLGFYNADSTIQSSENPGYLSMRLSREFSLGADGSNISGLLKTTTIDMSEIATTDTVHFTVSICGSFALLSEGCVVYVYRLRATSETRIEFVTSVVCPRRVLAVSMDTSSRRFAIAILLDSRMGLVYDILEQESKSTYRNLCSEEDIPRSVAICPQRRCVAFGCHGGIELHWVDALTGQDLNRWFPLTAPSDFLYFLPPRRGIDSNKKLRLISSAVHPNEASPLTKRFGVNRGSLAFWGTWEPRAGQSDHFQAVPLSDGYHILFMDPNTGGLCLGSDAPLGGPTKLLRKIWMIPPPGLGIPNVKYSKSELDISDVWKIEEHNTDEPTRPSVYASGADMRFGVRVVAGYNDHIVLFSIPPDILDGSMRVNNDQGDLITNSETLISTSDERWRSTTIEGCYIGKVTRLIDLAVDSGPNMSVYAFSANGQIVIYKLRKTNATLYTGDQLRETKFFSQRNGDIICENMVIGRNIWR